MEKIGYRTKGRLACSLAHASSQEIHLTNKTVLDSSNLWFFWNSMFRRTASRRPRLSKHTV